MSKQYDLAVYIGRFQPFHNGHQKIVLEASKIAKNVLILIGSSRTSLTSKNPWSTDQRLEMIENSDLGNQEVIIDFIPDYTYNDTLWIQEVGQAVEGLIESRSINPKKIAIIGHSKDHSSFYLNYFPQWKFINFPAYPEHGETIDATKIRNLIFKGDYSFVQSVVPPFVYQQIVQFIQTDKFKELQEEWNHVQEYKRIWSVAPYPPTFVTVDAIVVQSGHVLLIQRGISPGKGKWAMPGGFVNPNEKIKDSVIRELREETRLKVPDKVLKGSILDHEVFDDPDRSPRGRTITHAFLIKLNDTEKLPRVKGSDDAMDAAWIPFSQFEKMEPVMNEDHWHIVNYMISKL